MLTKQLFAAVAQGQILEGVMPAAGQDSDDEAKPPATSAHLVPIRAPLIDWARMLEAEADIPLTADPFSDMLARLVRHKYGEDSVPHKLLLGVREADYNDRLSGPKPR